MGAFWSPALRKFLQLPPLSWGEFGRHLDDGTDQKLALTRAAQVGHAFAAQFEQRAVLRAGRDFDHGLALESGHVDFAAQCGGDKGHRHFAEKVGAVAGEDGMLADMDHDVEIPGGGSAQAGFTIAAGAQTGTVLDSGGNLQFNACRGFAAAVAAADFARMVEGLAGSVAAGAGLGDLEKATRSNHLAASAAGRASMEARAGSAAGSSAGGAMARLADFDFFFDTVGGFLEFDFQIVAEVRAPRLVRAAVSSSEKVLENSPSARAEDLAKQIERIVESGARTGARTLKCGISVAVVSSALVGIGENVIGLRNLLETLLRLRVTRIAVRMLLHGELAIGDFDFFDGSAA